MIIQGFLDWVPFSRQLKISLVVRNIKKCLQAQVALLDHMVRHSRCHHSGYSRHLEKQPNMIKGVNN